MNPRNASRPTLLCVLLVAFCVTAFSQTAAQPDLATIAQGKQWKVMNRQAASVREGDKVVARLDQREGDGAAWLVDSSLTTGTIEVEIRGKNEPQRSFVGIAFHGTDDKTYEAVYFRPFNFRSDDPARRVRAVQYISHPEHTWQKLRAEQPGQFEKGVKPVPDPDGWFHARIEILDSRVRVYVDKAAEPTLDVPRLTNRPSGTVGLWVGNGSGGDFANLRLMPK